MSRMGGFKPPLPFNTVISHGRQYSFTLSAGCWDVMAGRGDAGVNTIASKKKCKSRPGAR